MLTFGSQDFQYFRVGLFDFHRARAPDRLLDIGSFPPRMPGCSAVLFLDLGMAAEQLHTLASNRSDHKLLLSRQALGRG
jgi:hypothetical protein